MKTVLCLLALCLFYIINEVAGINNTQILADCVKDQLGKYHTPMMPCFEKCAREILGWQTKVTECFFNNDPNRHLNGVNCITNDATCGDSVGKVIKNSTKVKKSKKKSKSRKKSRSKKKSKSKSKSKSKKDRNPREAFSDDEEASDDVTSDESGSSEENEAHERHERASSQKNDFYGEIIESAYFDRNLKTRMHAYNKCRFQCYFGFHDTNKKNLLGSNRFGRSIAEGVEDEFFHHRERRRSSTDKYFSAYLGHCYETSGCESTDHVAKDCMKLFFTKKDPQKFCSCIQKHDGGAVNCNRYTTGSQNAAQMKQPARNFMQMNAPGSGFSANGNFGGNNFISFSG